MAFPPLDEGVVHNALILPSPVTPLGSVPEVVADVGAPGTVPITIENEVVSAVCEKLSVTLTTTDAEPVVLGVPVIAPVEVFKASPRAVRALEPLCNE